MSDKIDVDELIKGVKEESEEHDDVVQDDPVTAVKLTVPHLEKIPNYYTELSKMEEKNAFVMDVENRVNTKIAGLAETLSSITLGSPWREDRNDQDREMAARALGGLSGGIGGAISSLSPALLAGSSLGAAEIAPALGIGALGTLIGSRVGGAGQALGDKLYEMLGSIVPRGSNESN